MKLSIFATQIFSVTSCSFWPYLADVLTTFSYPDIIPKTDNPTTVYFIRLCFMLYVLPSTNAVSAGLTLRFGSLDGTRDEFAQCRGYKPLG